MNMNSLFDRYLQRLGKEVFFQADLCSPSSAEHLSRIYDEPGARETVVEHRLGLLRKQLAEELMLLVEDRRRMIQAAVRQGVSAAALPKAPTLGGYIVER